MRDEYTCTLKFYECLCVRARLREGLIYDVRSKIQVDFLMSVCECAHVLERDSYIMHRDSRRFLRHNYREIDIVG